MAEHDEEQIEALRRWWQENGRSVIAGIVIGLGALGGWSGWNWYQNEQALAASAIYEDVLGGLEQGDYTAVREGASNLRDDYGGTVYAALGALAGARAAVEEGDLERAHEWLRWTVEEGEGAELTSIARARLARVVAAQGNADEALALLDAEVPAAFNGLFAEVRGDILTQQGERAAAADAYRQALDAEGPVSDPEMVRRKLDRLSGADNGAGRQSAAS
ncbi:MAG: tetratricopeptide repeat protein [Halofilum sp. (in: g-proteobacteria)]